MDRFSFLNTIHTEQLEDMYERYLSNPDSIEQSWRAFFQGFDFNNDTGNGHKEEVLTSQKNHSGDTEVADSIRKEFLVIKLIDDYRKRGHLFTRTNPVRERRKYTPNLDLANYNLKQSDLDTVFNAGEIIGLGPTSLRTIIHHLNTIYCESIGVEYMYIRNIDEVQWIQDKLNNNLNTPRFTVDQKKTILKKLTEAVCFESFLQTKYVGQKRFSLEGGESLIPAINSIIERSVQFGIKQFVLGMAHRGRLNLLTNIFGKPAKDIFSEFDGKDYSQSIFDGDVKYHLGWTSDQSISNQQKINLNISPNPSHLETVGAIVQGISRAKQERHFPNDFSKVLPIIIHGDAAISGQGLVYELIQMASLSGYRTNGTVHIVINNQIGFTTNYIDGRSSTYCTDIGKVTLSPVLHVNADDVEAVVHAVTFALEFRMTFKRDVFIDLLGYRKYGHNEGDEPRFTQPKLYKAIAKHKNPMEIYKEKLIEQGIVDEQYVTSIEKEYKTVLEEKLEDSKLEKNTVITPFMQNEWENYHIADATEMMKQVHTGCPKKTLVKVAEKMTHLPKDKKFIRKVEKLIKERHKMVFETNRIDWAMGELLAYGTLLSEGFDVRISGQDVERGTFSHRHAVLKTEDSENKEIFLKNIDADQGQFSIYNSLLSEYAVMGFEYGYAMANPNSLTIWEAQFGDFSNGAQIIIDQYVSSGEDKWKTQNGLVLFLPHGYEGQGAEHSSARIERYLQLCAKDNMFVANCTTPANLFHLLRRQMKTSYRKPLVIFTPKSLLRHPLVHSPLEAFENGTFEYVIDDTPEDAKKITKVVFCSGKFYYDLLEEKHKKEFNDVALVRLELLFPLPKNEIKAILKKYHNAKDVIWAQEEPRNMGVWSHLLMHYEGSKSMRVASRRVYASPASGSPIRDKRRQKEVIDSVFEKI